MEGIYLTHFQLLQIKTFKKTSGNSLLIILVCILLIGFCKVTAVDPLRAEMTMRKYDPHLDAALYFYYQKQYQRSQEKLKNAEETLIKVLGGVEIDKNGKAIKVEGLDPLNTAFNLKACLFYVTPLKMDYQKANDYLEKAINHFNGDIVLWSLYDIKGRLKLQLGSPLEAKVAFEKALHLNPEFRPAQVGLAIAEKALAEKATQPNSPNKN
jgi:tetratricopeptide (TPR) repeat protein